MLSRGCPICLDYETRFFRWRGLAAREAQAAAELHHPNIVAVFEVGQEGGLVYIVSEFIEGRPLDKWLSAQGRRLADREAAKLCVTIAESLHYAHEHGVVRRDLKPSNIMMDALGQPHLMDFGLAKRAASEITMTVEGQVLGTPAYMSPEQALARPVNALRASLVRFRSEVASGSSWP
jgi:serine/threonine protein kinase